ncbi:MAG: hypothetical protein QXP53_02855 [Candidatus Pacearchaeota archaeon]
MNKFFSIFIVIGCLILLISYGSAKDIDISLSYKPYPAHPGDILELEFEIQNNEASALNLTLRLEVDDPFNLISGKEKSISLEAFETKTILYKIEIDPSAEEEKEEITLRYKTDGDWNFEDFDIIIAPRQVYLEIVSVNSIPEKVAPGQEVEVKMKIKNTANSEIKNVILKLNIDNLPFAPQSVTEQRIASLNAREEKEISLRLFVLAEAEIKTYKIPLEIIYEDSYGKNYTKKDSIALQVYEAPSIELNVEKNELIMKKPSKVQFKVLNKGLGDLMFVETKILNSADYSIEKGYEYIGKISSDDYDTVDFQVTPKKQSIILKILINYRDSNNQKYSEIKEIPVKVYTISEARTAGLLPKFPWIMIVILVIIAIIVWRVSARKKKKLEE